MLFSLLLSLTPAIPTQLNGFYGREVQAWLLGQIAQHASEMAQALHGYSGPKPYTVSSLIIPDAGRRDEHLGVSLIPGNECLLRITSLSEPLTCIILEQVLPNLPKKLKLKWSEFRMLGPVHENPWCGQTSYGELVRRSEQNEGGPSSTLEFTSPTAFRFQGIDQTLPTPAQVWRSLFMRWNAFSPQELHIDPLWTDFVAACMVVSDFQLRSMKVSFKQGEKGAATGCTGQATYRLLPERHCGEYAAFRPGADRVMHALAAFAMYSGVGHHTTIGLGQTRAL